MGDLNTITCLNCGSRVTNNYCTQCGQKAEVERFTPTYLWQELTNSLDVDKGVFRSLWLLMVQPGQVIRKYILGERKKLTDPLKLFLLVGAIATFLTFRFNFFTELTEPAMGIELPSWKAYYHYSSKYFTFFNFTAIPLFALFSWLLFFKSRFNLIENFVMNCYIVIGQLWFLALLTPMFYYFDKNLAFNIYSILNTLYNLWALIFFFQAFTLVRIGRVIIAMAIPYLLIYFFNYAIFILAPDSFWRLLDIIVG